MISIYQILFSNKNQCSQVYIQGWSRLLIGCIFFAVILPGCNTTVTADKKHNEISLLTLKDSFTIPVQEKERMQAACEAWYDSVLKPQGFNGGILVAKYGSVIFEKYNGTAHIPGNDSVTENTPMHIASVSKTFTAMGILNLWQQGMLNIDDEYSKYYPAFNYPGVTIRCLLNHRSGLPNYTYFMESLGWDKKNYVSNEDILDYLITHKAQLTDISPPDTHFSYCNTNYALLALLIEKISGMRYGDYIRQTFFIPLQMKNSYVFNIADTATATPSYNWHGKTEPLNFLDKVYGDKNIYTTVRDLLKWDRALSGNTLFKKEILEQAYSGYSNEKPGIKNYGLGWRMYNYPTGKKIIYHNGWWHGSNASFTRLINDSATIIVIGNKFTRAVYRAKALASVFGNYFGQGDDDESETAPLPDVKTQSHLQDTSFAKAIFLKKRKSKNK